MAYRIHARRTAFLSFAAASPMRLRSPPCSRARRTARREPRRAGGNRFAWARARRLQGIERRAVPVNHPPALEAHPRRAVLPVDAAALAADRVAEDSLHLARTPPLAPGDGCG